LANKKTRLIILLILPIIFVLPIVFFIIKFFPSSFSQNISDWGSFGSFMWSYLTFVVTCFYVYFFYQLTVKLNFLQENATNRNISQIRMTAITDLRMAALSELKKNLNSMADKVFTDVSSNELLLIQYWFADFVDMYDRILFKIDDELKNSILNKIDELKNCKEKKINAENRLEEYYSLKSKLFINLYGQVINDLQNVK
jgi:hypothetical protein